MTRPVIRLVKDGNALAFPNGTTEPELLIYRYPAGDIDIPCWPVGDDPNERYRLAAALYDLRECSYAFPDGAIIELPDGTPFDFDQILADTPCPYEP